MATLPTHNPHLELRPAWAPALSELRSVCAEVAGTGRWPSAERCDELCDIIEDLPNELLHLISGDDLILVADMLQARERWEAAARFLSYAFVLNKHLLETEVFDDCARRIEQFELGDLKVAADKEDVGEMAAMLMQYYDRCKQRRDARARKKARGASSVSTSVDATAAPVPPLDAAAVIQYVASRLDGSSITDWTGMALRCLKIMWFASAACQAVYHRALLNEAAEAWDHGPAYPTAYRRFMNLYIRKNAVPDQRRAEACVQAEPALGRVLDAAIAELADVPAKELEFRAHRDLLWMAAKAGCNQPIPDESLAAYYYNHSDRHPTVEGIVRRLLASEPGRAAHTAGAAAPVQSSVASAINTDAREQTTLDICDASHGGLDKSA